jgi:spermidine synthase
LLTQSVGTEEIGRDMSLLFEELDFCPTAIGALSLRRRRELSLDVDVFEIKLGDEYLMTSLFTASEIALGRLGIASLTGDHLDIVVGGLGLGYTAQSVLEHDRVSSLIVVEMLDAVIEWHRTGLLPLGPALVADERCRLVLGDFFAMADGKQGFDPCTPGRRFDAILLDIDHSPKALLDGRSDSFYQAEGLRALTSHIKPGGIFGLWSNDGADHAFVDRLSGVFAKAWAEPVTFHNPLQDRPFTQTIYLARTATVSNEAA